jgi:hypothetical protein
MPHLIELRSDFSSLLETAERIGTRFAKKYETHLDESVAEALCQLVFYFHSPVYEEMGYDERTCYAWIRFRLKDYFNKRPDRSHRNHHNEISWADNSYHSEGNEYHIGMKSVTDFSGFQSQDIEWLGDFLGDDNEAFKVVYLLQRGLEFQDIMLIPDITKRSIQKVRKLLRIYLKWITHASRTNSSRPEQSNEDHDNSGERAY